MPTAARNPSAGTKGERTRAAILDVALRLVSKAGLDGLTIGTLAEATGMSKSGLFAHFGSREELLLAVLAHGQGEFTEVVFQPAMTKPRGLPRLRAMFTNWPSAVAGFCNSSGLNPFSVAPIHPAPPTAVRPPSTTCCAPVMLLA